MSAVLEKTKNEVETENEWKFEVDYGITYAVAKGWYAGLELRNHNEVVGGKWEHSALFGGPTISYARDNFWVNLTVLPQLKGLKGATRNGLVLDEHEKLETRLIFSYAL